MPAPANSKLANNPFTRNSTLSIVRALVVFGSCKIPKIETRGPWMLSQLEKVFGETLTYNTFPKWFFFDHFCAGRDMDELQATCKELSKNNIGAILDYAAEAELVIGGNVETDKYHANSGTSTIDDKKNSCNNNASQPQNEEDRIQLQLAAEASALVEKELPQAESIFRKALEHESMPLDVVRQIYPTRKKTKTQQKKEAEMEKEIKAQQEAISKMKELKLLVPRIISEVKPLKGDESKLVAQHSEGLYFATEDQLKFEKDILEMDANVDRFLVCINNASALRSFRLPVAYAALKVTALCDTVLLARLNAVLLGIRSDWLWFSNPELASVTPLQQCRLLLVGNNDQQEQLSILSVEQFREALNRVVKKSEKACSLGDAAACSDLTSEHIEYLIKELDPKGTGFIEYLAYTQYASEALCGFGGSSISDPQFISNFKSPDFRRLTSEDQIKHQSLIYNIFNRIHRGMYKNELTQLRVFYDRLDAIFQHCVRKKVRIMVDAEQTYYQTAIDHVVRECQRKYNKTEPVISNTYQAYTEIAEARVINDLRRSDRENWVFAAKIVRGAYIEEESILAKRYNYRNPIWDKKELTDLCYNSIADRLLKQCRERPQIAYGVLFGTHNVKSTYYISNVVKSLPYQCKCEISFAQLFGMSDELTHYLTKNGFLVFKYVPYGPVKETLAYLMRRAQENRSMLEADNPSLPLMLTVLRLRLMKATLIGGVVGIGAFYAYEKLLTKYSISIQPIVVVQDCGDQKK